MSPGLQWESTLMECWWVHSKMFAATQAASEQACLQAASRTGNPTDNPFRAHAVISVERSIRRPVQQMYNRQKHSGSLAC